MERRQHSAANRWSAPRRAVEPLLSGAVPYVGGKRLLAKRIIARVEKIQHLCYAEPFVGMGSVFLRRRFAPKLEVINDRSRDVATLFRIVQRHYQAFLDMMKWQLATRVEFERLIATDPDILTDLERSARFYYLQRTGFGGKVISRSFGVSPISPLRFDISLAPQLEELHIRLAGIVIENLAYGDFIRRYDRVSTLFYLDPPYFGSESHYRRRRFGRADFEQLAAILRSIQGRFILFGRPPETGPANPPASRASRQRLTIAGNDDAYRAREILIFK